MRAWAVKHSIPIIDATSGKNKRMHRLVEPHRPLDPEFTGLFCISVSRAPAPIWRVHRFGNGGIDLTRRTAWVNHYSFHIIDAEWGHVTIKLCGHPHAPRVTSEPLSDNSAPKISFSDQVNQASPAPFLAQIMLNAHEYVARQLPRWQIEATQQGNCFTETSDAAGLSQCAETSCSESTIGRLWRVCERPIYSSALCFALDTDDGRRTNFHYDYSLYQVEFSRNDLFRSKRQRDVFFHDLIDRVRRVLDVKRLKTIFGRQRVPYKHSGRQPRLELVIERYEHDLTVFKVHFGLLTLKVYTKSAGVLRVEVITHNTRQLKCGRVLRQYAEIVSKLRSILERFVGLLAELDMPWISAETIETLPRPSERGNRRVAGIDLNKPRLRAALEALLSLAASPDGFTAAELASQVSQQFSSTVTPRQAAYDLGKFRAKGLVQRIPGRTRYQLCAEAVRPLAALYVLREKVIHPLLSRDGHLHRGPLKYQTKIDAQYHRLQREMQQLFKLLRIAA